MNHAALAVLNPEQVEVEIWRADELEVHRGLSSVLDEMWSFVKARVNPRWLWHPIEHHTGKVLAYETREMPGGAAGKAANLVGCKSPRRQLPDSDG